MTHENDSEKTRTPSAPEPSCRFCKTSREWSQRGGGYIMHHPFYLCVNEDSKAFNFWMGALSICPLYEEDPSKLDAILNHRVITPPKKITRGLIKR